MSGIDDFSVSDRFASCLSMLPRLPSALNCFPSSRSGDDVYADRDEREGLLGRTAGPSSARHDDAYDDADAISLLSNIATSDARRAARRRARGGGRGLSGVGSTLLACGLFGRARGQIQQRETTVGSASRRAAARSESDSGFSEDDDRPPRPLTPNVESGDEDAGMLNDAAIAKLSRGGMPDEQDAAAAEARRKVKEEAEAAAREAEEADRRLADEEAQLAAQEEAAVAKARRKAERRAAKAGLASRKKHRGAEAQADAAAGGFGFAEEQIGDGYDEEEWERRQREGEYGEWEDGQEGYEQAEGYYVEGGYGAPTPQEVVHHHHYYHGPASGEASTQPYLSPTTLPALPSPSEAEEAALKQPAAPAEEDEDDADIAGLSFGKKKRRERSGAGGGSSSGRGGAEGGSSSGGRVRRGLRTGGSHGSNSASGSAQGSASGLGPGMDWHASRASVSSVGAHPSPIADDQSTGQTQLRPSYRDKPRRHERASSRSTNNSSSAGRRLHVGTSGGVLEAAPTDDAALAVSPNSYLSPSSAVDDPMPPPSAGTTSALSAANLARSQERRQSDDSRGGGSSSAASRRARGLPPLKPRSGEGAAPPPWARHDSDAGAGSLNRPRNPAGAANIFS